ncbi:MAG: Asp-tRNA(Asn)/Glu-tRNA(Gln) amidotransferase subunit GatC, partial [Leptospira sp.]|nr:Asp-tRNA(Asn)/Glu-tRNA(Gln) amidotransferase subunit GatC [Leptospira sp.]
NLAKLKIDDSEIEGVLGDFNKITGYVDQIRELDTSSVGKDEIYLNHENSVRPDVSKNSLSRDDIAKFAPQFENGFVVVPQVIET